MGGIYLNVKKQNLNNKRLSRLQVIILKVLSILQPYGISKRHLCRFVAEAYGKGAIITRSQKEAEMVGDMPEMGQMLEEMRRLTPAGARRELTWINPKFSVSFSRSIKSLLGQGLVQWRPLTEGGYGIFITEKGVDLCTKRKAKVKADFWDQLISLRKNKEEADQGEAAENK